MVEGVDAIYTQLGWLVEQPQVYAFAIPVLGLLGQIAPVVAGRRHAQHTVAVILIGLFGLLSVGGWSQPWFQGSNHDEKLIFIVFGLFAVLPVLGSIGAATDTIAKSSIAKRSDEGDGADISGLLSVHGLGAIGAALLLLAATVAGLARVIQPWDLGGRTTTTAVMNLVLYAAVAAAIAGIWFWAPKISGNQLPASMGRLVILDVVAGAGAARRSRFRQRLPRGSGVRVSGAQQHRAVAGGTLQPGSCRRDECGRRAGSGADRARRAGRVRGAGESSEIERISRRQSLRRSNLGMDHLVAPAIRQLLRTTGARRL